MDQHPVPRQITTFEFKLIGFFTLKQFGYLAFFSVLGYICYALIPIPIVNIVIGILIGSIGFALVFIPINDRPLDVFITNFIKKLYAPSQFYYHKTNQLPHFLKDAHHAHTPDTLAHHLDAHQKLSSYIAETSQTPTKPNASRHQEVHRALNTDMTTLDEQSGNNHPGISHDSYDLHIPSNTATSPKKPYLRGTVRNNKRIPLPNILVYIKSQAGKPERILKTNLQGVFATFHPLEPGAYRFEIKDPEEKYQFDTMEYTLYDTNSELEFCSRELL